MNIDPFENSVEVSPEEKDETTKLREQVSQLTTQLETTKTECETQIMQLTKQLKSKQKKAKSNLKKVNQLNSQLTDLKTQLAKEKDRNKQITEKAAAQDKYQHEQLEALAEQMEKVKSLLKIRDEELLELQKQFLMKKDSVANVVNEPQVRSRMESDSQTGTGDTTVLRRRISDLEMELTHLKGALQKDSKYKIYLLVRETGQRTLEELSKVLGVGIFEARRRVQELVRAGLLALKDEQVTLARR